MYAQDLYFSISMIKWNCAFIHRDLGEMQMKQTTQSNPSTHNVHKPEESICHTMRFILKQFLLFSTIFYVLLDFHV